MTGRGRGLKLYMDTAEKERLEMFNPPEETPELFERKTSSLRTCTRCCKNLGQQV